MVSYVIDAMAAVTDQLIINANRNINQYQQFGFPIVTDQTDRFDGPLAGVLTAMLYAETGVLLVAPCDSPLIKAEQLHKLLSVRAEKDADVAVAFDGERLHPVFLAVKTVLKTDLQVYLDSGQRKFESWLHQQKMVKVDFSGESQLFINLNSMTELAELEGNQRI
jgi:molybdopterin-guanine dinucleotide biosynthesis protein A